MAEPTSVETPTVFIVDDEESVGSALGWLFESVHLQSRTFTSAKAFLREFNNDRPVACLITDLCMADTTGLELLEEIKARGINLPVIVLTAHGDVPGAVRAMKLGAIDFVQKPFNAPDLLRTVNHALRLARERETRARNVHALRMEIACLSSREREVLFHLLEAESSKEIGRILNISYKTVDVHRATLMRKLGVASFGELMRRYRDLRDADCQDSA